MDYVPQCVPDRRPIVMWLLVAVVAMGFVSTILVAPIAFASGLYFPATAIYQAFSHVCHQLPERSFAFMGYPLAVCARCTGIYVGFAGAVFVYPAATSLKRIQSPARKWLFLSTMPLALDFGLDLIGVWQNTLLSRALTGAVLGAVVVFFVLPGLIELSLRLKRRAPAESTHLNGTWSTNEQLASAPSDYSSPDRRI